MRSSPACPDWLAWTDSGCTADDIWGSCGWSLAGVGTVQVPAGTYLVRTTVTEGAQSSVVDVTIVVAQEDAFVQYTGESVKEIGKELALRATVWDSAAAGYAGPNPEAATGRDPRRPEQDLDQVCAQRLRLGCADR